MDDTSTIKAPLPPPARMAAVRDHTSAEIAAGRREPGQSKGNCSAGGWPREADHPLCLSCSLISQPLRQAAPRIMFRGAVWHWDWLSKTDQPEPDALPELSLDPPVAPSGIASVHYRVFCRSRPLSERQYQCITTHGHSNLRSLPPWHRSADAKGSFGCAHTGPVLEGPE